MYIILDEDDYVKVASWGGILPDGFEVENFQFDENINAYKYENGEIKLDSDKLLQIQDRKAKEEKIQEFQQFLADTDHISIQWLEEEKMGSSRSKTQSNFDEIMEKRREARNQIRELKGK